MKFCENVKSNYTLLLEQKLMKGGVILKKINYLLLFAVLIFLGCSLIEPKITVNFDEIGDLQEAEPVIIDSIQIDKVIEIKQNRNQFEVKIRISYEFRNVITKIAKFYV